MILLIVMLLVLYAGYAKYCETKQIESISRNENLTFEELELLIKRIKA